MALTALEIYKLLPKTNCKACGFPTCLAFAMQMAAGKASIEQCPPASAEAKATLGAALGPPLPRIVSGDGHAQIVLGDEVVLYRHEKTFYHPTTVAVSVRDDLDDGAFDARVRAIRSLSFERVGQTISVDAVAVRHRSGDPARFARAAARAWESAGMPLVLIGPAGALAAAVDAVRAARPVLYPPAAEAEGAARLAAAEGLPLVVRGRGIAGLAAALGTARAAGAKELIGDPTPDGLADAVSASVDVRRLAITHRAREIACPTAFDLGEGFPSPFAAACLLTAKYGSLLVLDDADPAFLLPLLTLRQNIFTDPQRPIQVEGGIYDVGKPGPSSPVIVTTNFSLTFFTVRGDVEGSRVPARLLIAECEGMSVLTAWAAGKFSGESIARLLKESGIEGRATHRTLIIPGLVARLSGKIEELSGWRVLVGPQESSALPSYLRRLPPEPFRPVVV